MIFTEELDRFIQSGEYSGAGDYIRASLDKFRREGDRSAELTALSELIGFCRKSGLEEEGLQACADALALADELNLSGKLELGTTLLNCGTAYKVFKRPAEALDYYEAAKRIYEQRLDPGDERMAALFNNMALALQDLGRREAAEQFLKKALTILENCGGSAENIEKTKANMADIEAAKPQKADGEPGGLKISRLYFEQYGLPMLQSEFPELMKYMAVGFTGSGSEHYGFDDAISRDHDFEPGFCIFLPGEDVVDRRSAFLLERAYSKLPKEFMGLERQRMSPVGGNRNGVFRTAEYFTGAAGSPDGELSKEQWLSIPDYALAEAVNGEVFFDGYGELTSIRRKLSSMPEDVRRKRIAGNLLLMAQAGQYNYQRCLSHGEKEAAQLACSEFVIAALKAAFLLRGKYMPFYKWSFRAFRSLDDTAWLADKLSSLLLGGDEANKEKIISQISSDIAASLRANGMTNAATDILEAQAYAVNNGIKDAELRNMNILAAV